MKRITLVKLHAIAASVALLTIITFFSFSLVAEIMADELFIKEVKKGILLSLPVMLLVMPLLNITGNRLTNHSINPIVSSKQKRMKIIMIIGIGLISLSCFLYYWSHYQNIDGVFLTAQVAEFILGVTNFILIGLNVKSGFQISGRFQKKHAAKVKIK